MYSRTVIVSRFGVIDRPCTAAFAERCTLPETAALKIHWSTVPRDGEELFGLNPTLSTETLEQRIAMKVLRKEFIREHEEALTRWNAGERGVAFPAGTVRMRLRHKVGTEPIPDWLRVA